MRIINKADLRKYSGFNTGGRAEKLAEIYTKVELKKFFAEITGGNFFVIGRGFNTLINEDLIKDSIIVLKNNFEKIELRDGYLIAGAGASLGKILRISAENALGGLEFLAGIPGTAGGAVKTNCGAFGESFAGLLAEIEVFDTSTGFFENITPESCSFSYRSCGLDSKKIITEIKLSLKRADKSDIIHNITEYAEKKSRTQPLNKKSCGCVFKNPPSGPPAGQIIEEAGLKGLKIGGALVSRKHANYIINDGTASSFDILKLIKEIKKQVKSNFSVELETEIGFLGFSTEELNG